ncbi:phospholipid-transporting ATPase ID [Eurytemora carolleeae]|uniref:phospholipid-transporting ATPase ID n=1 Tax=Eurytemora carolleeae TaxID=1294199 RepID=UPI000C7723B5|nr:phospholipid-transporting ATPase ID [Eurytemora carolleeae]|eukprot:XP_023324671.1 phospholipid-transporting ATPase ID-like [Eurytemora affinis]
MGEDESSLSQFSGHIICEAPNNNLAKFEGTLTWNHMKYSLDNEKILLRGAVLRNTPWCYGLVLFAGKDTKLMQNSGKTKFKRTSIDRLLNFIILGIVLFLLCMCLFCTISCGFWETWIGLYFQKYLPWDNVVPKDPTLGAAVISLLVFFSYAIVLNTVVPISLYVSVEVIRLFLSKLIDWDKEMYYEKTRTHAKSRTTTLNEELGQIQYIFSDKTGTLTQNIMTFNKCSINSKVYGDILDEKTGEPVDVDEYSFHGLVQLMHTKRVDFSQNSFYEPSFQFYDSSLLEEIKGGNQECQLFFRVLALCHTVMPDYSSEGRLEYQAQSPDENALVSAARNFGFVFTERTSRTITIKALGETEVHELLCILDFNNVRKRMSVILRHEGKIRLYCKGADNVIFERLKPGQEGIMEETQDHLNKFASEGLRTLVLGVKDLTQELFDEWKTEHHKAAVSLENRDEKLDEVYDMIEKDLHLVGATAIEDKLQDGVSQTIANLEMAGIKIWVLTGDKQETAINIGYSCNLLSSEMEEEPYIVDGTTHQAVEEQLLIHRRSIEQHLTKFKSVKNRDDISMRTFSDGSIAESLGERGPDLALVVNGHSLVYALQPDLELLFLGVAEHCTAVICCRVTPLQKALVVELVKKHKDAVTLAIGDGANDVSMIKAADIGVGISGQEGMQAVLASDYSIAQFRYLERLLLVHGRWSYYRMCKFLRYFFYKNFAFTLCHFWYAFFCGFSAQNVYDEFFLSTYNMLYTAAPVVMLGALEQDLTPTTALRYPGLYQPGLQHLWFSRKVFATYAIHGLITSLALIGVTMGAYHDKTDELGKVLSDHYLFGSVVASVLVIVVTAQVALDTQYWTIWNHLTIWGSLAFYFALTLCYNWFFKGIYVGSLLTAMSDHTFWFVVLLTTVILILPVVAWRFFNVDVRPTLADKARLVQRSNRLKKKGESGIPRPFSGRRSRRSVRSGYAFSHSEGFGRLITSGRIINNGSATHVLGNGQTRGKNGYGGRKQGTSYGEPGGKTTLQDKSSLGVNHKSSPDAINYHHQDVPGVPMIE